MSPDDTHLLIGAISGGAFWICVSLGLIVRELRKIAATLDPPVPDGSVTEPLAIDDGYVSPPPEAETVRAVSPTPNRAWPFASDPEGARIRTRGGYPSGSDSPTPPPPPGPGPGATSESS